jgi:hypothetical protein
MALTLSVTPVANVTPGSQYVAGWVDPVITGKLFTSTPYTGTGVGTVPTAGTPVPATGLSGLPGIASLTPVFAADGGGIQNSNDNGDAQVGYFRLNLSPAAGDVVNASSPQQIILSPNALVITATSAS